MPFKPEQRKDPSPSNQNDNSNHNDVPIVAAQDNQSSESKSPEESSIKPAENTTDLKSSFETLSATLRNDPTLGYIFCIFVCLYHQIGLLFLIRLSTISRENELSQAMNNGAMQINVMKETRGYLTMRKGPDIKKEKTFYFVLKRNTMFYYEKVRAERTYRTRLTHDMLGGQPESCGKDITRGSFVGALRREGRSRRCHLRRGWEEVVCVGGFHPPGIHRVVGYPPGV
mgnify:CR=1 FL=1